VAELVRKKSAVAAEFMPATTTPNAPVAVGDHRWHALLKVLMYERLMFI
jgi:hypothetical protein